VMAGRLDVSLGCDGRRLGMCPCPQIQYRVGPLLQLDSCHCMLSRLAAASMCLLVALHDSQPTVVWITAS
jgi:hypothetical protein